MIPLWIPVDPGDIMGELLLESCKYFSGIWTKMVQNKAKYGQCTTKIGITRDYITFFGFLCIYPLDVWYIQLLMCGAAWCGVFLMLKHYKNCPK